jgi:hypothetical protein
MTGNTLIGSRLAKSDVLCGMAAGAVRLEMSSLSAPHRWHVLVTIITLQWMVAGRVAIHTAWMGKHFANFIEDHPRTLGRVRDRREVGWLFQRRILGDWIGIAWRGKPNRSCKRKNCKRPYPKGWMVRVEHEVLIRSLLIWFRRVEEHQGAQTCPRTDVLRRSDGCRRSGASLRIWRGANQSTVIHTPVRSQMPSRKCEHIDQWLPTAPQESQRTQAAKTVPDGERFPEEAAALD